MIPFWKAVGRGLPRVGGPVGDAQPAFPCQVPAAWLPDKKKPGAKHPVELRFYDKPFVQPRKISSENAFCYL